MRRTLAAAALAAAIAGTAGCTGGSEQKAPDPLHGPDPLRSSAATDVLKDGLILAAVKAQLTALDPNSATTLGVGVHDGVVTLRGSVRDRAARDKVVAAARTIAGVKGVVTQLRVDPSGPRPGQQVSDAALATRITAAVTVELGYQHVAVHVDRGNVTLEGSVKDDKAKAAIDAAARATSGVRNVVDRIRVETP
ncbi:MAG: hypothetical protein NVS3B7_09840 [Candidatus Elarobacter sp.]